MTAPLAQDMTGWIPRTLAVLVLMAGSAWANDAPITSGPVEEIRFEVTPIEGHGGETVFHGRIWVPNVVEGICDVYTHRILPEPAWDLSLSYSVPIRDGYGEIYEPEAVSGVWDIHAILRGSEPGLRSETVRVYIFGWVTLDGPEAIEVGDFGRLVGVSEVPGRTGAYAQADGSGAIRVDSETGSFLAVVPGSVTASYAYTFTGEAFAFAEHTFRVTGPPLAEESAALSPLFRQALIELPDDVRWNLYRALDRLSPEAEEAIRDAFMNPDDLARLARALTRRPVREQFATERRADRWAAWFNRHPQRSVRMLERLLRHRSHRADRHSRRR